MIDLSVVFLKYQEYLASQQQLNSLLSDLFPTEKRDRHIIMEICKSEYWEKIKDGSSIDERAIYYWSQMISQDTGIAESLITEGIKALIDGRNTQIAVDNWELHTGKKLSLERGDFLYCADGSTASFEFFASGEVHFIWKRRAYHRPISDIDKTLFLCPIYDENGFDKDGFDKDGFDPEGFNREGYNREGYSRSGQGFNSIPEISAVSVEENDSTAYLEKKILASAEMLKPVGEIFEEGSKEEVDKIEHQGIQSVLVEEYNEDEDTERSAAGDDTEYLSLDGIDIVPTDAGKHLILGEWVPIRESRQTENIIFERTLSDALVVALSTLTPREAKVLQLRFGLEDGRLRTLEEVGREFNVEREVIRQIEAKALRKLRHPSRSKHLRDYLYGK